MPFIFLFKSQTFYFAEYNPEDQLFVILLLEGSLESQTIFIKNKTQMDLNQTLMTGKYFSGILVSKGNWKKNLVQLSEAEITEIKKNFQPS